MASGVIQIFVIKFMLEDLFDIRTTFVTPEGFQPTTNRVEICGSMQLSYGVKFETYFI